MSKKSKRVEEIPLPPFGKGRVRIEKMNESIREFNNKLDKDIEELSKQLMEMGNTQPITIRRKRRKRRLGVGAVRRGKRG